MRIPKTKLLRYYELSNGNWEVFTKTFFWFNLSKNYSNQEILKIKDIWNNLKNKHIINI